MIVLVSKNQKRFNADSSWVHSMNGASLNRGEVCSKEQGPFGLI